MIKDDSFVLIQGWMINIFNLKGLELMLFALIFSFTNDGESEFSGSLGYLCEWTNSSNFGVRKALSSLLEKDLVRKEIRYVNNIRRCYYSVNASYIHAMSSTKERASF